MWWMIHKNEPGPDNDLQYSIIRNKSTIHRRDHRIIILSCCVILLQ